MVNQIQTSNLNTLTHIKELYPKDLATGYSENQNRGIWSITFNK